MCSGWYSRADITRAAQGNFMLCHKCFERHLKALSILAGVADPECAECHADGGPAKAFMMHFKDGIYQFLCHRCSGAYARKRLDLYGETQWGHEHNLKGAK